MLLVRWSDQYYGSPPGVNKMSGIFLKFEVARIAQQFTTWLRPL
jgi:hypothetical protein